MIATVTSRKKPEDEELLRKRAELSAIQTVLAERELELTDFRLQLAAFEGRYLREVGALYADLDEWKARIAELRAQRDPSGTATQRAEEARERARQTREAANGEASKAKDFKPSPELRKLWLEVSKRIHPDRGRDDADRERRTRLMAEANRAYENGDADTLRRILDEFHESSEEDDLGEGIGAELIRIIRQISKARERIADIDRELARLRECDIFRLKQDTDEATEQGRDLLAELAASVRGQIQVARQEYEALAGKTNRT